MLLAGMLTLLPSAADKLRAGKAVTGGLSMGAMFWIIGTVQQQVDFGHISPALGHLTMLSVVALACAPIVIHKVRSGRCEEAFRF